MVAGVTFRETDPTIITFGQPATLQVPCAPLNKDKYYRFINTRNYLVGGLKYDAAPFVEEAVNATHTGRALVLGDKAGTVVYYRDSLAPDVEVVDWSPNFLSTHDINDYILRVEDLLDESRFPVPMDGFPTGYVFTATSECRAPDTCEYGFCRSGESLQIRRPGSGLVGDACKDETDCLPENWCDCAILSTCQPKLGSGARCSKEEEFISGVCTGFGLKAYCE